MKKVDWIKGHSVEEMDEIICYLSQWVVCGATFCLHVWFLIMFAVYSVTELFIFNIGSVSLYAYFLFMLARNRRHKLDYVTAISSIEIILHQLVCVHLLDTSLGFQQFLIPTSAYMFLCVTKSRKMQKIFTGIAASCITLYALMNVFVNTFHARYEFPEGMKNAIRTSNTLSAFAILIVIVWVLSVLRRRSLQEAVEKAAELEEIDKKKTKILTDYAHDVRVPLNAMIGFAELSMKEEISEKAEENLQYIWGTGKNLLTKTNDLITEIEIQKREKN